MPFFGRPFPAPDKKRVDRTTQLSVCPASSDRQADLARNGPVFRSRDDLHLICRLAPAQLISVRNTSAGPTTSSIRAGGTAIMAIRLTPATFAGLPPPFFRRLAGMVAEKVGLAPSTLFQSTRHVRFFWWLSICIRRSGGGLWSKCENRPGVSLRYGLCRNRRGLAFLQRALKPMVFTNSSMGRNRRLAPSRTSAPCQSRARQRDARVLLHTFQPRLRPLVPTRSVPPRRPRHGQRDRP